MAKHAKFVQLAVVSPGGEFEDNLYALDMDGEVWLRVNGKWRSIAEAEAEGDDPEEEAG
jgi:hypothetical protein